MIGDTLGTVVGRVGGRGGREGSGGRGGRALLDATGVMSSLSADPLPLGTAADPTMILAATPGEGVPVGVEAWTAAAATAAAGGCCLGWVLTNSLASTPVTSWVLVVTPMGVVTVMVLLAPSSFGADTKHSIR